MDSDSVVSQVQRKIELQSPEDLSYLIANVRSAAAVSLNDAFPHVAGQKGEDELRTQIEALVNEYIDKTFSLAAPNILINAMPIASADSFLNTSSPNPDPVYEPFDTRKRRRVADLITQEERLLEEVAALKRSVPARAATAHADRWRESLQHDAGEVESRVGLARERAGEEARMDVAALERQEGVEERWRGAVEGLAGLKRDMPAVVARMERARVAGEYVLTEGR